MEFQNPAPCAFAHSDSIRISTKVGTKRKLIDNINPISWPELLNNF